MSQLNSPTVQIDPTMDPMIKFYQQQQQQTHHQGSPTSAPAAISSPVVETPEPWQPADAIQTKVGAVVKPAQLSDLQQELAKLHQKRYVATSLPPTLPITYSEAVKSMAAAVIDPPPTPAVATVSPAAVVATPPPAMHRKISRFQVSAVNEPPPMQQAQPADSIVGQLATATASGTIPSAVALQPMAPDPMQSMQQIQLQQQQQQHQLQQQQNNWQNVHQHQHQQYPMRIHGMS